VNTSFSSFLGSVIYPVSAEIAAVSGLHKKTSASFVPHLPLKFLLKVLSETPEDFGDCPIPMQGPHAFSRILAPESIRELR